MTTNYNTIAQEHKRSKQQPWRHYIECFTLFEPIGDLAGKAVLEALEAVRSQTAAQSSRQR